MSPSLDTCWIRCPRLPSDIEARRGVRRSKEDPSRLEYIFGYDKITLTLKDPLLGIELPSDSLTQEGSIYEGNYFIQLRERSKEQYPQLRITIDLGDSYYDNEPSYDWYRENSSEPGFDYNPRNENLNEEALLKETMIKMELPLPPALDLPNGRVTIPKLREGLFLVRKSVLGNVPLILFQNTVLTGKTSTVFPQKMSVKAHPRLILRWHRVSSIYKKIKSFRVSSERSNSNCKENDLDILERPRARGLREQLYHPIFPILRAFLKESLALSLG